MIPLSGSNLWNEGLRIISRCPLCESTQENMEARILGESDETRLLHLRCKKCSSSILAMVLLSPGGVSSVGLLTDLTFEDVGRLSSVEAVNTDDVLKVHEMLESGGLTFLRD